jgi:hypothetical protein
VRPEPGGGDEREAGIAGGLANGRAPHAEAAAGRSVGTADDEELVGQGREPAEEWNAERAAPEERDPAEH